MFTLSRAYEDWNFWPMFTPVLGNITNQCRNASLQYISSLNSAFIEIR